MPIDTENTQPLVNGNTADVSALVVVRSSDGALAFQSALRTDGTLVGAAHNFPVQDTLAVAGLVAVETALTGNPGRDWSSNSPSGPGQSSTLVFNGTTLSLLVTIPLNLNRTAVEINNTSGALAAVVLDNGADGVGTESIFPLVAGAGAFQQGGDFSPPKDQSRIRVYGVAGGFIYARET
jgi:hypothetical protein